MKSTWVVTWQTPSGNKKNICLKCEKTLEGNWPKDWLGEEYCQVSKGEHEGYCDLCEEKDNRKTIRVFEVDSSAFLPIRGKKAQYFRGSWQRFRIRCTQNQFDAYTRKCDALAEEALETNRYGKLRAYERQFIKRHH